MATAFDRGHTARRAPAVALRADALVRDLVSRIADGEAADLVTGVAEPLPVAVIADLLPGMTAAGSRYGGRGS